jgi:hypothetical protein
MSGFEPERGSEAWQQHMAEQKFEPGSEAWHQSRRRTRADRPWYTRKRTFIPAGLVGLIILPALLSSPQRHSADETGTTYSISSAGHNTAERPMSFEDCNRQIRTMADQMGTPADIVDSTAMRLVRFPASDGSVLVTCDAIDEKMIIVKSPAGG